MSIPALWFGLAVAAVGSTTHDRRSRDDLVFADNGVIKVGMSLERGGAIAFLVSATACTGAQVAGP